jgi:uncharacterized membrane protein
MKSGLPSYARIITLFALAVLTGVTSCSRQPIYPPPAVSDGNAVVDVSALKPETPQFFTYQYRGKNISFFLIRMNGGVQSYFDACVTCYPKKRGYQNKDGYIECRACDMHFSVYKLEKGMGGCYPIKLEGRMENGRYLIPVAALEKMEDKF